MAMPKQCPRLVMRWQHDVWRSVRNAPSRCRAIPVLTLAVSVPLGGGPGVAECCTRREVRPEPSAGSSALYARHAMSYVMCSTAIVV
eukprot:248240-Rhodomonas_salina.2